MSLPRGSFKAGLCSLSCCLQGQLKGGASWHQGSGTPCSVTPGNGCQGMLLQHRPGWGGGEVHGCTATTGNPLQGTACMCQGCTPQGVSWGLRGKSPRALPPSGHFALVSLVQMPMGGGRAPRASPHVQPLPRAKPSLRGWEGSGHNIKPAKQGGRGEVSQSHLGDGGAAPAAIARGWGGG